MAGLRTDVIAQIEELSTLVGDLVDLTRDDAGVTIHEPVDMSEVVDRSLERVRRRRNDIEFDVDVIRLAGLRRRGGPVAGGAQPARQRREVESARWPRRACGCARSTRCTPNWWCPTTARASRRRSASWSSSGSTGRRSARAMPGSGLGLAIVKQVVVKHGGTLRIDDTVPGGDPPGTSIHVVLPGRPDGRRSIRTARDTRGRQRWTATLGNPENG